MGSHWFKLFLPFAAGYFLSYLYRTVNAVVGPLLGEELTLGAADLGLPIAAINLGRGRADELLSLRVTEPADQALAFLLD